MEDLKIILITQARYGSSRLPGKILKKINNESLLKIHLNRLKKCNNVTEIHVATTNEIQDEVIYNTAIDWGFKSSRGSEHDVLDRFYKTALKYKGKIIVRICGDCPFIDPKLIDKLVNKIKHDKIDYISNTINPTYPDGLDVEVLTFNTLKKTWLKAKSKDDKEHVTRFIIKNKNFKKINYKFRKDLSNIRLTIDEKIDLEQLRSIYFHLKRKENFGTKRKPENGDEHRK